MTISPKIDLAQTLLRRRVSVTRWLEDQQIGSLKEFKSWMKQNSHAWTFTENFVDEAKSILSQQTKEAPAPAPLPPSPSPPEDSAVSDVSPAQVEPKKHGQKKAVYNSSKDEL